MAAALRSSGLLPSCISTFSFSRPLPCVLKTRYTSLTPALWITQPRLYSIMSKIRKNRQLAESDNNSLTGSDAQKITDQAGHLKIDLVSSPKHAPIESPEPEVKRLENGVWVIGNTSNRSQTRPPRPATPWFPSTPTVKITPTLASSATQQSTETTISPDNPHFCKIAVVGPPNAGKSTLLNSIIGKQIGIVSELIGSTTSSIRGIWNSTSSLSESSSITTKSHQVVFVDTPGYDVEFSKTAQTLNTHVWSSLTESDVDHLFIIVEARRLFVFREGVDQNDQGERSQDQWELSVWPMERKFFRELGSKVSTPATLIINKVDLLPFKPPQELLDALKDLYEPIQNIILTSFNPAHAAHTISTVQAHIHTLTTPSPHIFPFTQCTDQHPTEHATSLIRGELWKYLRDEVPYAINVFSTGMQSFPDNSMRLFHVIQTPKKEYRRFILGPRGASLKNVESAVSAELSNQYGHDVNVIISVQAQNK